MNVAIMQPYFLPYLGYFQLIALSDMFVIYDDVEYTKKGWINRNRLMINGKATTISLSLKKDSDFCIIKERYLASNWPKLRDKLINQIIQQYKRSPYFQDAFPTVERILMCSHERLDLFVFHSIKELCLLLEIKTPLKMSSEIIDTTSLKAQEKIYSLCTALEANSYLNPIGGRELYNKKEFMQHGLSLNFLEMSLSSLEKDTDKEQFYLSIIHILFTFGVVKTKKIILNEWAKS
ncbi:WbqC family protein [Psychrosphaera sp.]|nr:WbqC family protein [Psychrosphaera sp.]